MEGGSDEKKALKRQAQTNPLTSECCRYGPGPSGLAPPSLSPRRGGYWVPFFGDDLMSYLSECLFGFFWGWVGTKSKDEYYLLPIEIIFQN